MKNFKIKHSYIYMMPCSVILLVLFVQYLITSSIISRREKDILAEKENTLLLQVHSEIDRTIENTAEELNSILSVLNDQSLSTEQTAITIRHILSTSTGVRFVSIFNAQGNLMNSLHGKFEETSRLPVPETLELSIQKNLEQGPYCIDKILNHDSQWHLPIILSWQNESNKIGYLWTTINMEKLESPIRSSTKNIIGENTFSYLTDSNFFIIMDKDLGTQKTKQNVKETYPVPKNVDTNAERIKFHIEDREGDNLVTLLKIPQIDWWLILEMNSSSQKQAISGVGKSFLITAIFFVVLFGSLTYYLPKIGKNFQWGAFLNDENDAKSDFTSKISSSSAHSSKELDETIIVSSKEFIKD